MSASVLDTAPDAVLAIDDAGRVAGANRTAEAVFGRPADDLAGAAIDDLLGVPHAGGARAAERPASMLDEPEVALCRRLEVFGVRADGTRFPADVILTRTGGDPPMTAWVRDLSGDAGAHAEAIRRKALLERAEHIAQAGSWQWNPDTDDLLWSDELYRLFGYEPGAVTPTLELITRHVHPDDLARWRRSIERLAREYSMPTLEYRITRADGALRWLRATVAVVEESPGGTRLLVGSTQDITDARRAERQIAAHIAVSRALADWDTLERGGVALLRDLARAMDFVIGTLWVPWGDVLVAVVAWREPSFADADFGTRAARPRYPRGTGLPGHAWERREPVVLERLEDDAGFDRRLPAMAERGLRGALALPAIAADEVLAVLEFFSREDADLTEALLRSLTGIGYEIGQFLSRRRGELRPRILSAREAEVLQLAAAGHSGRRIAERLVLTQATVKTHFEHIYEKLGVSDRAAAVAEGLRLGLIE